MRHFGYCLLVSRKAKERVTASIKSLRLQGSSFGMGGILADGCQRNDGVLEWWPSERNHLEMGVIVVCGVFGELFK